MGVILEFTIEPEAFQLGAVLHSSKPLELEFERVVPTGLVVMPFVWVTGDDHEPFEASVRDDASVDELVVLDRVEDRVLYRIEWSCGPGDLVEGIAAADAIVLEARGSNEWFFRLRFPNHATLSTFHNHVIEADISLEIERTYSPTADAGVDHRYGLSAQQREALVLALRRGYFETPGEVSLDEIADELGISRQAVSERIRLGNKAVLENSVL